MQVTAKVDDEERAGTWSVRAGPEGWRSTHFQPIALPAATPTFSPEAVELRQLLGEEEYAMAVPPGEDLLNWVAADLDGDGGDAVRTCPADGEEPEACRGDISASWAPQVAPTP